MMRLICPNCGAQYEVADDVIPVAGRDVQCSNCSHTWFEQPGASEAAEAGELLPPPAPDPEIAVFTPEPAIAPATVPAPVAESPAQDDFADFDIQSDPVPAEPVFAAPPGQRRGLSEDLAEMLREEAAREAAARAAEAPARPTDFSLPPQTGAKIPNDQGDEDVRRRTARLRGEESDTPPRPATAATRRELLPDIEMINSSLRPSSDDTHIAAAEPVVQARKRGARFGFSTVMLIVAILVGLYAGAPRLSTLVPAAEPVLTRYVAVVDDIRLWIDLKMQAFITDQSGTTNAADPAVATPQTAPAASDTPATEAPASETPAFPAPLTDPQIEQPAAPATETPATDGSTG